MKKFCCPRLVFLFVSFLFDHLLIGSNKSPFLFLAALSCKSDSSPAVSLRSKESKAVAKYTGQSSKTGDLEELEIDLEDGGMEEDLEPPSKKSGNLIPFLR